MSLAEAYPHRGSAASDRGPALLHFVASIALMGLAVSCFVISFTFGLAATFLLTLGYVTLHPRSAPTLILVAFALQNLVIAMYAALVDSDAAFESLRGANFVVLMTLYGAFILASLQPRARTRVHLRRWILFSFIVLAVIAFYTAVGAVTGEPRDAIVYFRNTVTALACFHIALVATSLYRIDIVRPLTWLTALIIAYGYLEVSFTIDFLGLFGGDLYLERAMRRLIENGYWEQMLARTGFVYLGLQDAMTARFFNTPFLGEIFPKVFRIGGPNFHPISFAYLLALASIFLLLRGRWALPLLALPLLIVIGSKGATVLFILSICVQLGLRLLPPTLVLGLLPLAALAWISLAFAVGYPNGDYHTLGLVAGLREFAGNPLGHGIGLGGNLSSTAANVDFDRAQAQGFTAVPMESAIGVMLYQMGIGAFVVFGFLAALAMFCFRAFRHTADRGFLFGYVGIVVISANALLQEEAFYSPLALGLCLLITGHTMGSYWRSEGDTRCSRAAVA